jgi:ADP-ribose pyrophosphatase YjhB (NUDIX family)
MDDQAAAGNGGDAIAGASMIVLRRGSVLMVERAREPSRCLWSFPAGRAQLGEDAEANARRELFEETGLVVGRLVRLGQFRPPSTGTAFHITVFAARAGVGMPVAADDAARAEFVAFERVLMRPHTAGAPGWIARAIAATGGLPEP